MQVSTIIGGLNIPWKKIRTRGTIHSLQCAKSLAVLLDITLMVTSSRIEDYL